MSYLLYCITNLTDKSHPQTMTGVSGEPVQLVVEKKLCIAMSKVNHTVLKHSLADVLSFQRVVESFHAQETIIPMRYGGIVEDAAHAKRVLASNRTAATYMIPIQIRNMFVQSSSP